MNKEKIEALEVKPKSKAWFYVTLYQYKKKHKDDVEYFRDWIYFDGNNWMYEDYINCYVCFISDKRDTTISCG